MASPSGDNVFNVRTAPGQSDAHEAFYEWVEAIIEASDWMKTLPTSSPLAALRRHTAQSDSDDCSSTNEGSSSSNAGDTDDIDHIDTDGNDNNDDDDDDNGGIMSDVCDSIADVSSLTTKSFFYCFF